MRSHRKGNVLLLILIPVVIVAIVLIVTFAGRKAEQARAGGPDSGVETVNIGGVECIPKLNIKTYLFMGIDNTEEHTEERDAGGQADVLRLLVVDRTAGTYTQLPIDRNTIMTIGNYDSDGEYYGDSVLQASYAYMGGGGGTISAENTVNAVSNFLMGQKIDGYVALNMEAIPTLNHLAGGVTVTIEDDFSQSDPSLIIGNTVKLTDDQAMHYVHDRMNVGDGSNECRMRRQNAYVEGLKDAMKEKMKADDSYILDVYRTLSDSMVTDMTEKEFGRIADALMECESEGLVNIEGTKGYDKYDYVTFTADEQSVTNAVIKLFYRPQE